jgi:LacI family repressor for deo operon, udp, cdd, tsx, nupC, and nupG
MTTIRDVAQAAGVSRATAARVLSAPELVAEATRHRVLKAVQELGYSRNSVAASLRTTRTGRIIVTVPDISNPFFSRVIRGVEEAAQKAGYAVLLGDTRNERDREEQYADMLNRREADGIIFLGHRLPTVLATILERDGSRAPIVNGCEFTPSLGVSSAHIDNAGAGYDVMQSLYRLGHRDIAVIIGPADSPLTRDRLAGAQKAAEDQGLAAHLVIGSRRGAGPVRARQTSHRHFLLQRRDGDRDTGGGAGRRHLMSGRCLGRRFRRHPDGALRRSAARHRTPADGGNRPENGRTPARHIERSADAAGLCHAAL